MTTADDRALLPTAAELVALLRAVAAERDRQAFAALYRHFAPRVKSYGLRLRLRPDEAEELAQETLLAVWRKAALFDPARAGVSTWIFAIARNLFIDGQRRVGRAVPEPEPDADIDLATPEAALITGETEARVRAAIARLSPEQQAVIRLSYFSEAPQTEIAAALAIPLGTVKSRVRLAAERLRQFLDSDR